MLVRYVAGAAPLWAMLLIGFAACTDESGTVPTPADGGTDAVPDLPVVVTNDTESKQSGKIIRAQTEDEGVPGASVKVAGKTVVTNASGDYEIIVPRNTPYQMEVSAEGFFKLVEQEWVLKTETLAQGSTNLLLSATANLLAGLLPGRKAELGLVVVKVNPMAPCASEEGTTLTIDPPGEAKIAYFNGSLPDSQKTSVRAGSPLSAAIYNVDVGVPLTVTATSASCAQAAFPIDVGGVTYTGVQKAEAGDIIAYLRLYLKDPVVADAGTDAQ